MYTNITVFWIVTPCGLLDKMEAAGFTETLLHVYWIK